MRLTIELVEGAFQFMNKSTGDRELDLRDYKITTLENLGATLDQFDAIDFTSNDIRTLENFPLLNRIKRLYFSNNRISKIDERLHESIPNLEGLIMINNQLQELGDLDSLAGFKKLTTLALMGNPVSTKKHYRLYLIHRIPSIRLLDFKKVKIKERNEADKLFSGEKGKRLENEIGIKSKTFVPGGELMTNGGGGAGIQPNNQRKQLTTEEIQAIKQAISKANTLEEMERLKLLLKQGYIPNSNNQ
ncbi:U2 small nuclear ribonucleoprotein A' [Dermatophagoides pteronyssinus]|uniref:U2 small nuclear ribonucleoprotein A n=1 Tax=Dermatophagoides pteronyssinus TaxID=6956 RepID=A0ABQ8JFD2_DERPT|nr:U2 small nuclear ribonucleoprotein A' [Dermatophagoides pteronyssinus]